MGFHSRIESDSAFGPEAVEAMARAFEEACAALRVFAGDENGRQIVATRIIDLARFGELNAATLRDRVIHEAHIPI
jgi:hypothetical protein